MMDGALEPAGVSALPVPPAASGLRPSPKHQLLDVIDSLPPHQLHPKVAEVLIEIIEAIWE
jgi:hypothetical protein